MPACRFLGRRRGRCVVEDGGGQQGCVSKVSKRFHGISISARFHAGKGKSDEHAVRKRHGSHGLRLWWRTTRSGDAGGYHGEPAISDFAGTGRLSWWSK